MKIQLSEHFTYQKLIRFVFPSVVMMIFTSVYSVVDGLFVSNYVGKTPFAAVNLIMPLLMILGAFGFVIGTGGSAIVGKALGEGKMEDANRYFSMLIYFTILFGLLFTVIGFLLVRPVSIFLGAEGEMLAYCIQYGQLVAPALTGFLLLNAFQSFLITAERPKLGLAVTVTAGLTNIVLDFFFVAVFHWGLAGAAIATAFSQTLGGVIPLVYFLRPNTSLLKLTNTNFQLSVLLKACSNGASELVTNLSASIVTMLYNFQLLRLAGEDGVAAYGAIMYVHFIFSAIFFGYTLGSAPVVSYHFGAGNHQELKNLFKKSVWFTGITGIFLTVLAELFSGFLTGIFVGYDPELFRLTCRGFRLYSISFLVSGFPIFGSAFFTALNDGKISAAISFLRTLVFQISMILIMPLILGIDGVWLAITAAESLSFSVTLFFFCKMKERYHYA